MIFLTIGTQLPFDRLVKYVDAWAGRHPEVEIFGQIGRTDYLPANFGYTSFMNDRDIEAHYSRSKLIVGHAGMGTIISSLSRGKPVLVVPREFKYQEHRNDHQVATCARFADIHGFYIARDAPQLFSVLDSWDKLEAGEIDGQASSVLLDFIDKVISS